MRSEIPAELRYELTDPGAVVRLLGLDTGAARQGGRNVSIRCVFHEERSASCSVHVARDGTIALRCHACGATGDVLSLVAAAHDLDARRDFVGLCTIAASLAGRWDLVDELRGTGDRRPVPLPKPRPEPEPERDYPRIDEVRALLTRAVWRDDDACAYLRARGIDPVRLEVASTGLTFGGVEAGAVAYALEAGAELPRWASYRGTPWSQTGHRLLVPMVDAAGELRSVRAIRVDEGDSPKRLPPGGHRAAGLVMGSELAVALLRGSLAPSSDLRVAVRIVEGEPDFLTALTAPAGIATAVLGIVSGSWVPAFASRIPAHALVAVQTHNDAAGERYAAEIHASLIAAGVAVVTRISP